MSRVLQRDVALLLLRLGGVGLAVGHGWGKVMALGSGRGERFIAAVEALGFPLPVLFAWAAALAEFLAGLCVALGLGTRISAAFAGTTMFVAAFLRHRFHLHVLAWLHVIDPDPQTVEAWGDPELAVVYLLGLTVLVLMGGGRFSLDRVLWRRGSSGP